MAEAGAGAMRHLFSAEGDAAIARLMRQRPLLAFDFDGTLAPIVSRPDDARIATPLARRLALLARHGPVAIISGRSVSDVRARLGFEPAFVVGNHGAEGMGWAGICPGLQTMRERAQRCAAALRASGVQFEDKGQSLALHYRLSPRRDLALRSIQAFLKELPEDVRSFGGKCVFNLVPAMAPDKGDAAVALLQASACSCLLFVGDDLNDEPVFERAGQDWLTVRIGRAQGQSRAMYFLDSQAEMGLLLDRLQQALP